MTREEAISRLHWYALDNCDKARIDEAIEALSATSQNLAKPNNADDLISRADAIEAVKHSTAYMHDDLYEAISRLPSAETTGALDDAIAKYVADGLMELPSAEAVEVVRCGECKHMIADGRCMEFADDGIRPSATDFCSYGVRREDGEV